MALGLAVALPVRAEEAAPLATLHLAADHGTFLVKVSKLEEAKSSGEKVLIKCIEECRQPVSYEEIVDGNILGVFELLDIGDIIFSTWADGDDYVVRVYKIGSASVTKIFDEHTVLPPDFINVASPGLIVRTSEFDQRAKTKDMPIFTEWRWDGASFNKLPQKSGKPKIKSQ